MRDKLLSELPESEQEIFFLGLLKPDMKTIVGKRGLDEILGSTYNPYNKTKDQIMTDILEASHGR